jgi:acyl-coenzyme A synthetase/AMP-(fatty) acid ligase
VLSAGEPLPARIFLDWKERFGKEVLDNLGCTEMFNSFLSNRPGDAVPGTLGGVVTGYEIRVGSSEAEPGSEGELRVRGDSRALAVGADESESGSFRSPSEWHETGDEVRVDREGRIVFLGRRDHRFKVKGRFVHPLEIERRLGEVAGVRECIVVPETGRRGLTVVGARLVAEPGVEERDLVSRVLSHARRRLAAFEVPERITIVPALRRSPRGKLERPSIDAARGASGA